MKFQSEQTTTVQKIALSGALDETLADTSSQLRKVLLGPNILFDWTKVTFVNSMGIAQWAALMQSLPESWKIQFSNCPRYVIDTINMVPQFLGRAKVMSFYMPFWCPSCHHREDVLFNSRERLLIKSNAINSCSNCKNPQRPDCLIDEYLMFL